MRFFAHDEKNTGKIEQGSRTKVSKARRRRLLLCILCNAGKRCSADLSRTAGMILAEIRVYQLSAPHAESTTDLVKRRPAADVSPASLDTTPCIWYAVSTGTHPWSSFTSAVDTSGHILGLWFPHTYTPRTSARSGGAVARSSPLVESPFLSCCLRGGQRAEGR